MDQIFGSHIHLLMDSDSDSDLFVIGSDSSEPIDRPTWIEKQEF